MRKLIVTAAVLALALVATPQGAMATPEFAKQWASSCASCHVGAPTGLDEEGIAFKLAGYDQAVEAENPRPKLFLSLVTDLLSFRRTDTTSEEMETPESTTLFSLVRLDRAGKAKLFAIGELTYEELNNKLDLELAHGHLQVNPLEERVRLSLRAGNIEPITRLWNSDMRRVFESSLWGGVESSTGAVSEVGGGHAHGHGGGGAGVPGVMPASDWGGDISSVIRRNVLLGGGWAGDTAFAGVFYKRGGRGFDNSTVDGDLDYAALSADEQQEFNRQQTNLAKKWERSVILGLSAYVGSGDNDVFDGSFLSAAEAGHDEHGEEEHGEDEHGEEGDGHGEEDDGHGEEGDHEDDEHGEEEGEHGDGHAAEEEHHETFFPAQIRGTSRLVGEVKTRFERYGLYVVGVYGENEYEAGDPEHWEEHGQFERVATETNSFVAWAIEGSARFKIAPKITGRLALRWEVLDPEVRGARSFERAVANFTVPIRIMRPALWPYLETSRNFVNNDWEVRGGLKLGY